MGESKLRAWFAAAAVMVIAAGLASRDSSIPLPSFVAHYAGDTLWAVLVYLLLAFAMPRRKPLSVGALALVIAFAVEFLQLYQAPWLNAIRDTTLGKLALGQGFLFSDLLCYTSGVGAAVIADSALRGRGFRDLPTVAGTGLCLTVLIAIVASNAGQGPQLFGFVDRIPGKDKTGHFLLMGGLSFFVVLMLVPRLKMPLRNASALVIGVLCVVIAAEEASQHFISSRSFSIADGLCSLAGIVVFGALAFLLLRARPS